MKAMRHPGLYALFLVIYFLSDLFAQSNSDDAFEAMYVRLSQLQWSILKNGTTDSDQKQLQGIRNSFVAGGGAGTQFLIRKVSMLNEEEARVTKTGDAGEAFGAYESYLRLQHRTGLTKGVLCLMLADSFSSAVPVVQEEILQTLALAYTPSYRIFHSNPLDWALARIGRPAVPTRLRLAGDSDERLSCHFSASLEGLGERSAVSNPAPKIDCHGDSAVRKQRLAAWSAWWQLHGLEVDVPIAPSFFDDLSAIEERRAPTAATSPESPP